MAIRMSMPTAAPKVVGENTGDGVVILCADEVVRDALAFWLSGLATFAQVATDGYHANQLVKLISTRLLVTDRVLPPWPGLDTFRTLRERSPGLRIAFIDSGNRDDLSLARVTGVTDILPRPLTRLAVADAVGRLARAS